jgi:hypothetical protein
MPELLVLRQRCCDRIRTAWPGFADLRRRHLIQGDRFGRIPERATEEILRELFTSVLDWPTEHVNWQVERADIVLTSPGVRWLVVEAKRPGALAWNERAVHQALDQALKYAAEQHVRCVAISDGQMLYAADVAHGGLRDRVFVSLDCKEPPEDLWWLSVHGIYRSRPEAEATGFALLPAPTAQDDPVPTAEGSLLHPKYHRPAACFAFVGDAGSPATWKLPYLLDDGTVDLRRLPMAISAILKTYRGVRVGAIPESAVPDVLLRLARAAASTGKLPVAVPDDPSDSYGLLACILYQEGRFAEAWATSPASEV